MSRHSLTPHPGQPDNREVIVGWDSPLGTFYAQVLDAPDATDPDGDEEIVLWTGSTPYEITNPSTLTRQVSPYATLPQDVLDALIAERNSEPSDFHTRPAASFISTLAEPLTTAQAERIAAARAFQHTPDLPDQPEQ